MSHWKLSTFIAVLCAALGSTAFAAEYSESTFSKYEHAAWVSLGFTNGGLSLGADYEYAADRTYGVGGLLRFYNKDDDRTADGIMVIGGFIRPHFHRRAWDLYVTPGFGIINIDGARNRDDATTLGPFMSYGVLYQVAESMAVGVESMTTSVWFDEDYRGIVMTDVMFRGRFSF